MPETIPLPVLRWPCDLARPAPRRLQIFRGETVRLEALLNLNGAPVEIPAGATATLAWQSREMGGSWYVAEASLDAERGTVWADFGPDKDAGADEYRAFLRVDSDGACYRAVAALQILPSPGAVINEIPIPPRVLDFATIEVSNAPYWTKTEADERFAAAADIALEAAALGAWDLSPLPAAIQDRTPNIVSAGPGDYQWRIGAYGAYSEEHYTTEAAAQAATAITINGPDCPTPTEITREATAYRLGPDATANPNRDKTLAPADALDAKLDKSGGEIDGDVGITGGLQMTGQGGVMSNAGGFQTQNVKFIGMRFTVATDIPRDIDFPALKGGTLALTSDLLDPTLHPYAAASGGIALAPGTAVYRAALGADGAFPAVSDAAIPAASAYYAFEVELAIPATVPASITGPTGWTWLEDGELPAPSDLSGGETVYIAVRLDCASGVRAYTANVWRVA